MSTKEETVEKKSSAVINPDDLPDVFRFIEIKGARQNNLKDVDLIIPKNKLVCICGVSGSGKSSLVFDTIYQEAQRQFLETLSAFQRSKMPRASKPEVDSIKYLSPVIVVDQKKLGKGPRSTVGTVTQVYSYLRLLYSRCGKPAIGGSDAFSFNATGACKTCQGLGVKSTVESNLILDMEKSIEDGAILHSQYKNKDGYFFKNIKLSGLFDMDKPLKDWPKKDIDKLLHSPKFKVKKLKETGFNIYFEGISSGIERRSFNSEKGEVNTINAKYFRDKICPDCHGARLNEAARNVKLLGKSITDFCNLELIELHDFFSKNQEDPSMKIGKPIISGMLELLQHLIDLNIGYLSLNQPVATLSGGENQRTKLAKILSNNLVGMIYIADEPSAGLHAKDVDQVLTMLKKIRDKGNSVLCVEHEPMFLKESDHIIEMGPQAGEKGGQVVFQGTVQDMMAQKDGKETINSKFLNMHDNTRLSEIINDSKLQRQARISSKLVKELARDAISQSKLSKGEISPVFMNRLSETESFFKIQNAIQNNLKGFWINIPKNSFVCVTGAAGSGKSTLINEIFLNGLKEGQQFKVVVVDQTPVKGNSRGNTASYCGVYDNIRNFLAKQTGEKPGVFSFNSSGACENCKGRGSIEINMHFLESFESPCEICGGKKFNKEVLDIKYKTKNISDILDFTASEAVAFFNGSDSLSKKIREGLSLLDEVGLEYVRLGQNLSTLSAGEHQRLKLAKELQHKGNLYLFDEPTSGLSLSDIHKLLKIVNKLVDQGNHVIIIEHNLEIIKHADWLIDLGPDGGKNGGKLIFEGTPLQIIECEQSHTGKYLKKIINPSDVEAFKKKKETQTKTTQKEEKQEQETIIYERFVEEAEETEEIEEETEEIKQETEEKTPKVKVVLGNKRKRPTESEEDGSETEEDEEIEVKSEKKKAPPSRTKRTTKKKVVVESEEEESDDDDNDFLKSDDSEDEKEPKKKKQKKK